MPQDPEMIVTLPAAALARLLEDMSEQQIADAVRAEVRMLIERMASAAGINGFMLVHQTTLPNVRFFRDKQGDLYVAWNDACKAAGIGNPYLEGSQLNKVLGPEHRGFNIKLVEMHDLCFNLLMRRRAQRERANALSNAIFTVRNDLGIPPKRTT